MAQGANESGGKGWGLRAAVDVWQYEARIFHDTRFVAARMGRRCSAGLYWGCLFRVSNGAIACVGSRLVSSAGHWICEGSGRIVHLSGYFRPLKYVV